MSKLLLALTLIATATFSQTTTWTGGAMNSDWTNPSNWTAGVPSATTAVTISFSANPPSTSSAGTLSCLSLTVNAGAALTVEFGDVLQVGGNVTANGSINLDGTLTTSGSLSGSNSFTGTGTLSLVGTGSTNIGASPGIGCKLEIAKTTGTFATLTGSLTVGSLRLTSGTFVVASSSSHTLTVSGAADFVGGTLQVSSIGTLAVNGPATFSGTTCPSTSPNLRCAGTVASAGAFAASNATVTLVGSAATILAGSALPHLTLDGNSSNTLAADFSVGGSLDFAAGSTTTLNAAATVAGHVSGGGAAPGFGKIVVNGAATSDLTGPASLGGQLEIAKGASVQARLRASFAVGALRLTSGTFVVSQSGVHTLTVSGAADFVGGTLQVSSSVGTIVVNGTATFTDTACPSTSPNIHCAGLVAGAGAFAQSSAVVTLSGSGSTVAAGAALPNVAFGPDSTAVLPDDFSAAGNLSFAAGSNPTIDGVLTVGRHLSGSGAATGVGKVLLTGAGFSDISGPPSLGCALEIAKSATTTATLNGSLTVGSLRLTSGTFVVASSSSHTLTVSGAADFVGGTLQVSSIGTLAINGPATFSGTTCPSTSPNLRCAGTVASAGAFAASNATVTLVGSAATILAGSALPHLTLDGNSSNTLAADFSVGGSLDFAAGSTTTLNAAATVAGHVSGGGAAPGFGKIVVNGAATSDLTGPASLGGQLEIAKGASVQARLKASFAVGALRLTSGTFVVSQSGVHTLTVSGAADFVGGTLQVSSSVGTIVVNGTATFTDTACPSTSPNIHCAGLVAGAGAFAQSSAVVTLSGSGSTVAAGAALPNVAFGPDSTAVLPDDFSAAGNLSFAAGSNPTIDGVLTVGRHLSGSGAATGVGKVLLTGAGFSDISGPPSLGCALEIAKSATTTATLNGSLTVGSLRLTSGTFVVASSSSHTLTVSGAADFVGGTLQVSSIGTLVVNGTATFTDTTCPSTSPNIHCAGTVAGSGSFAQSECVVTLIGSAATVAAGTALPHLVVHAAAQPVLNDDFLVYGNLTVNGATSGTGKTSLVGNTNRDLSGGGTLGGLLEIAKGASVQARLKASFAVGALRLTSGTFVVSQSGVHTLTVSGAADFVGGTLQVSSSVGTIVVNGTATFTDTACPSTSPNIHCAGLVAGAGAFAQSSAVVTLSGSGSTVAAGAALPNVAFGPDSTAVLPDDFSAAGNLSFAAGSNPTIDGVLTVGRHLSGSGAATGVGKVLLTGAGFSDISGPPSLGCALEIAKSATTTATLNGSLTVGSLRLTSGTFVVASSSSHTLTVSGAADFVGGTLQVSSIGTLAVNGPATFSGTTCPSTSPNLRCAGTVASAGAFAASNATVTLVGSAATILAGSALPHLTLDGNSSNTLAADFSVGGSLDFAAGSTTTLNAAATVAGHVSGGGAAPGFGKIVVNGAATSDLTGPASLGGQLEIAKGASVQARLKASFAVGALRLTSGTFVVSQSGVHTLTVSGAADFVGGTLQVSSSVGTIVVNGTATFTDTACPSTSPNIHCAGLVAGAGAFAQSSAVVTLSGSGSTVAAGAALPNVAFGPDSTAVLPDDFSAAGNLSFAAGSNPTIDGVLTVGRHLSGSGAATGVGKVLLTGAGFSDISGPPSLGCALEIAKSATTTATLNGSLTVGSLRLTSGTFVVASSSSHTLTVSGAADFVGGTLQVSSIGTLVVNGTATFTDTTCPSTSPNIHCAGTVAGSGSFAQSECVVTLIGSAATVAAGTALPHLVVHAAAQPVLNDDFLVYGNLTVNGATSGTGKTSLVGNTNRDLSGGGTLGGLLEIAKGASVQARLRASFAVGALRLTSGTFVVSQSGVHTLTVSGAADFVGGTLQVSSSVGTIVVNGTATFTDTACPSTSPNIHCAGLVAGAGAFAQSSAVVTLSGSGSTVAAGAALPNVAFGPDSTAVLPDDFSAAGNLSFAAGSNPTIDGVLTVGRHLSGSGAATGVGKVLLTGAGFSDISGPPSLGCALEIAKSATTTATLTGSLTVGSLRLTSGTFVVASSSSHTLTVSGAADFVGGTLQVSSIGTLVVNGTTSFVGTTCASSSPNIVCSGDWVSDANFAPSGGGSLTFGGTGPTTIATSAVGVPLVGTSIVFAGTSRTAVSDLAIRASSGITINAGAKLSAGSRTLTLHRPSGSTTVAVNGTLEAEAGGRLALGSATSVTVHATGTLELNGGPSNRAAIDGVVPSGGGSAVGGYSLVVNGFISGRYFDVLRPNANGLVINAAAVIAPAPDDLRGARFDYPVASASARLLTIERPVPTTLFYLQFLNSNGAAAAKNVWCTAGAQISLAQWSGAFGGAGFENDPGNRIDWSAQQGPQQIATVGPTGAFADVQAALDHFVAGDVLVQVEGGTYPSFNVNLGSARVVRVYAEPYAPAIIDTTAGPVVVQGTAIGGGVELTNLLIGSPTASNRGVEILNWRGDVVLDNCVVDGGSSHEAVYVFDSPGPGYAPANVSTYGIAVQNCQLFGSIGLSADGESAIALGNGYADSLNIAGTSRASSTGTVVLATTSGPTATYAGFPWSQPRLSGPPTYSSGTVYPLEISGEPGWLWFWAFQPTRTFSLDLAVGTPTHIDFLAAVANPITFGPIETLDARGFDSAVNVVPPGLNLLGTAVVLQAVVFLPGVGIRYSNSLSVYGTN